MVEEILFKLFPNEYTELINQTLSGKQIERFFAQGRFVSLGYRDFVREW